MGRGVAIVVLSLAAGPAASDDWRPLDGRAIAAALSGATLVYPTARQTFYASGRTLYDAGEESWGFWSVEDDRYCSQWPPSDRWTCYVISEDAETGAIRFDGGQGSVSVGRLE